jgi:PAS domain-containing protein
VTESVETPVGKQEKIGAAGQIPLGADTGKVELEGNGGNVLDVLERMGRAFGDAIQLAKYPLESLVQSLPAAIYATDAAGRITFYNEAREVMGLPTRNREERVLRLLEALLAGREADGARPMSNGVGVERTA